MCKTRLKSENSKRDYFSRTTVLHVACEQAMPAVYWLGIIHKGYRATSNTASSHAVGNVASNAQYNAMYNAMYNAATQQCATQQRNNAATQQMCNAAMCNATTLQRNNVQRSNATMQCTAINLLTFINSDKAKTVIKLVRLLSVLDPPTLLRLISTEIDLSRDPKTLEITSTYSRQIQPHHTWQQLLVRKSKQDTRDCANPFQSSIPIDPRHPRLRQRLQ